MFAVEATAAAGVGDGVGTDVVFVLLGTTKAGDFGLAAVLVAVAGGIGEGFATGAGGSIGAGVVSSPAVAGAGIAGRLLFDASSMRCAAARVFMNPAAYTTRIADELSETMLLATLLFELLGAMSAWPLYNPGDDSQESALDVG